MPVFGHGAGPSLAASTSTLITTAATTKRNSRSLDLPSTRQPHNPPTLHHHIRSTSDGATTSASAAAAAAAASASASAKATQSPASAGGVLCSREQSQDSLSAALSNSIFNFKWPRSSSAAKDTDVRFRQKRIYGKTLIHHSSRNRTQAYPIASDVCPTFPRYAQVAYRHGKT